MTEPQSAIQHPLERLRGLIRRYVLTDGLLTAALFAILWFWTGLAVDYGLFKLTHFDWVLDAPKLLRVVALAALALVMIAILVTRLVFRLNKEMSYPSLALVLEKRFPKILGDKLITAVELANVEKAKSVGFSEAMVRQTIADAGERVKEVPVESVFNWTRLRTKAILLVLFAAGIFAVVLGGYAAWTGSVSGFVHKFTDVGLIWAERNLFLQNTPWPRNAHIELVEFPGDDLRVGKDAAAPKVRARAYQWVMADRGSVHGWRPAFVTDLDKLIPLASDSTFRVVPFSSDILNLDLDRFEADPRTVSVADHTSIFTALHAAAANPSNARTFRKLEIPEALTLNFSGVKSSGKVSLTREANNAFNGEVAGLKESVRFTVKGGDFSTRPKSITLVPPPQFMKLARVEYQPAYLYHPAPVVDAGKPPEIMALKGLRQVTAEKSLTLTGDKTVFTIVQGTEFTLSGVSDKPLSKIVLKPKIGALPGGKAGSTEAVELKPANAERDRFEVAFQGNDRPATTIEFDIVLVDDDAVSTARTIIVQVVEDQPPQVELAISTILRKQGNAYLVTANAMIPFQFEQNETKVKDDYALSKAEFVYSVAAVESNVVLALQAQALAGIVASCPLMPSIADALLPATTATLAGALIKDVKKESGAVSVPRFAEQMAGLRRDTLEALKRKLSEPLDADAAQIVKEVKFQNLQADVFDLRAAIPALAGKSEGNDLTARFRVELNLIATDANVESGPKTGQNLEPVKLIVISEADLLGEFSKDEEAQASRLDEVLKKLRDAQTKLNQTADRVAGSNLPAEQFVAAGVRAQDIAQDIAKCREICTGVATEYRRLYREAEFNRLRPEILNRYLTEIIRPLDAIIEKGFGDAEQAHGAFQQAIGEQRRPDDAVIAADKLNLAKLINDIDALRKKLGEAVDLGKLRNDLVNLRDRQLAIGRLLKVIKEGLVKETYVPELLPIPAIELKKGETKTVKQGINWKAYTGGALKVAITGPDELKFPASVPVPDDKDDFEYTLTANDKVGDFKLKLTPSAGVAIEVIVRVK